MGPHTRCRAFAALCLAIAPSAAQLFPRQTALTNSTTSTTSLTGTTTSSASGTSITPPPCCWVYGAVQAVSYNTWYTDNTYSEVVATVISTVLVYEDTTITANYSTRYANATWTEFGLYNFNNIPSTLSVPGVPTDLVPNELMHIGDYGATSIYRVNATNTASAAGQVM